eukprot:CAMPEP_0184504092 /NCGR_PEP_ID=MMETSP0113_2-20130426/52279_1 /TAXON_ID=91329 /ORGANISM="Norrisiella sphaerica, Strain BC52" /LENGTH=797 /DNA_ID=CAMNT_0026893709 /DNA_START=399 /DNA_END=2792 /DNA_ORIENTATION=-
MTPVGGSGLPLGKASHRPRRRLNRHFRRYALKSDDAQAIANGSDGDNDNGDAGGGSGDGAERDNADRAPSSDLEAKGLTNGMEPACVTGTDNAVDEFSEFDPRNVRPDSLCKHLFKRLGRNSDGEHNFNELKTFVRDEVLGPMSPDMRRELTLRALLYQAAITKGAATKAVSAPQEQNKVVSPEEKKIEEGRGVALMHLLIGALSESMEEEKPVTFSETPHVAPSHDLSSQNYEGTLTNHPKLSNGGRDFADRWVFACLWRKSFGPNLNPIPLDIAESEEDGQERNPTLDNDDSTPIPIPGSPSLSARTISEQILPQVFGLEAQDVGLSKADHRSSCYPLMQPRTLVRFVQAFGIQLDDQAVATKRGIKDAPSKNVWLKWRRHVAIEGVEALLTARRASLAAKLIKLFDLRNYVGKYGLGRILGLKKFKIAASLADWSGDQEVLVQLAWKKHRMSIAAWRYAQLHQLENQFPGLQSDHDSAMALRFAKMGAWDLAVRLAEESGNPDARAKVIRQANGEINSLQQIYSAAPNASLYPFPDEIPSEKYETIKFVPNDKYLHLPPSVDIIWVDSAEGLLEMAKNIEAERLAFMEENAKNICKGEEKELRGRQSEMELRSKFPVGIDAEWMPTATGEASKVSVLQLATPQTVFLVDLQTLLDDSAQDSRLLGFDEAMVSIFSANNTLMVGHGVANDLKQCKRSFPSAKAFSDPKEERLLELSQAWHVCRNLNSKNIEAAPVSLSKMAAKILGKPLDKSSAISDWSRRPLSEIQMRYAALDAHVSVQILQALLNPTAISDES